MVATAHLVVGAGVVALIRRKIRGFGIFRQIILVLILGIASHLVLDAISHEEYPKIVEDYLVVFVLVETVIVLLLVLSRRNAWRLNSLIFLGMGGAAIPDLIKFGGRAINCQWMSGLGDLIHVFHARSDSSYEVSFELQIIIPFIVAMYLFKHIPE